MRTCAASLLLVLAGCTPLRGLDEPAADAQAIDASRSDAAMAPVLDAASPDAPGLDAPGLDAPGADASRVDAPNDASRTDAPSVDAPALDAWREPDAGSGLIAWYPFDGTRDATGLAHTLTSTGVTFTGAIATLSAGAMLSTPSAADLDEITALSLWVRPSEIGGGIGTRVSFVARGEAITVLLRFTALPRCTLAGGSVNGTTELVANVWTHVACVRDGTTMTLYTNGVATGTGTATGLPMASSSELRLGLSSSGTDALVGDLSDVRFYRRPPTAMEIAALAADPP